MDVGTGPPAASCLLLADRSQALLEGMQCLLRSKFEAVVTVSDEPSLMESARCLVSSLVVLDLGLGSDGLGVVRRLRQMRPDQKLSLIHI